MECDLPLSKWLLLCILASLGWAITFAPCSATWITIREIPLRYCCCRHVTRVSLKVEASIHRRSISPYWPWKKWKEEFCSAWARNCCVIKQRSSICSAARDGFFPQREMTVLFTFFAWLGNDQRTDSFAALIRRESILKANLSGDKQLGKSFLISFPRPETLTASLCHEVWSVMLHGSRKMK